MIISKDKSDYLEEREKVGQLINRLEDYAEIEGTEIGEYALSLCVIWRYAPDYISDKMYKTLIAEIEDMVDMFENEYEIIEEKKKEYITIKRLEYTG